MRLPSLPILTLLAVSIVTAFDLAGCAGSSSGTTNPPPPPVNTYTGVSFGGRALAGKQPLIGASVQLYAAGTTGNGSSPAALLSTSLTTDANGAFTIPAGYICASAASQIYVVARGGKPGASAASANSAIVLLTALGACSQRVASSQVVVNEATTVAATYALSQFLSAGANLGSSATNVAGLENAAATAQALADITLGSSPGPSFATNGTSPAPRIDSVANLLNACAVSAGSACVALFSATTPTGGVAPTNTLDAAFDLVRSPAQNVAGLYTLSAASSAYTPVLAAAPADWTLFIEYTGGGMFAPTALGIDGAGNVWVASYFNVASLFSPLGKPLLPQGVTGLGLSASYGLAVDANNNAWIPNQPNYAPDGTFIAGNSVTVLNSSGQSVAGAAGFTAGGLDFPTAVVIDTDATAWVVDYGNSHLTHLTSSGRALSGAAGYTSPTLALPVTGAVDAAHNLWVANQAGSTVTKISPDGSQFTNYACCSYPSNLAIDQLGNVWVANFFSNSISEISSAGVVLANGTYTSGGVDHPQSIAIDGAGNVWIANFLGLGITELAGASAGAAPGTALSPSGGLGTDAALDQAYSLAVDASGNLWVTNFGSNILTQFIGLAPPVRTPLIGPPAAP
jgi:hypothetical protein